MTKLRAQSKTDRAEKEFEGVVDELLMHVLEDVVDEAETHGISKERVMEIVENVIVSILDSRMG